MSIDRKTSSRIEILRFPLIVGIVFIHNYDTTVSIGHGYIGALQSSDYVDFVRAFISHGIAQAAVPLFFVISGYLFFSGEWSWGSYASKLRRRVNTLLIPFLCWNIVTLAVYAVGECIPNMKMYFTGGTGWPPVKSFSLLNYMNALFGMAVKYPISIQFWFIRDLMALVVFAPAIHFLLARRLALPFIVVLFGFWFFWVWPVLWPNVLACFFFSLGAYLSRPGKSVAYLDRFGPWISVMCLGVLILHSVVQSTPVYLDSCVVVFGVPSLWWLTELAVRTAAVRSRLLRLSGASFFVFAAHQPLLMIIRKVLYKLLLPTTSAAILALYFLIPICLIGLLVLTHGYMQKTMPAFVGFITGDSSRPKMYRTEVRWPR